MRRMLPLLLAAPALVLVAAACGGDDDDDDNGGNGGGAAATIDHLGNQPVNDHGTQDVAGKTELEFETDDFYFGPTFLKGTPGQKLTLKVENEGKSVHNFSLSDQNVDTDIKAGGDATVEITFPESGVALFFCKYHRGQGMVGELLTGDATPAAVSASTGGAAGGTTPATTDYQGY